MATRSSGHYSSENYVGTRRGRSAALGMGWEMFPEKTEATDIDEDPEQLYNHGRDTLKDWGPDTTNLFAHEEVRRNNFSRDRLELRSGGARVNTDPWQNEDYDTQFHDRDPRGWSTEQPWSEYRRHLEAQLRRIDFKDDGDYSVPSQGIHPNTMYKNIKSGFNWVKSRLKIFSTSKDGWHNGGIGKYKWYHTSSAEKVDFEDTGVNIDQRYLDADLRTNPTSNLSNHLHGGSKKLRVNTTTDHKVQVSAYMKLFRNRGLIPHESQMRIIEDDTRWGKLSTIGDITPKNVTKLMSSQVNGEDRMASTAASQNRFFAALYGEKEKFAAAPGDEMENRQRKITTEVMSLLGFTEEDIKFLESYEGNNKRHAELLLGDIKRLTEVIHRTPANIKLQMRDELLMQNVGGGLLPADATATRRARDNVILNPKIIQFMDQHVRKTANPGDNDENRRDTIGDGENKLNGVFSNSPMYVFKSRAQDTDNIDFNRRMAQRGKGKFTSIEDTKTHSFKQIAATAQQISKNRRTGGLQLQWLPDTVKAQVAKSLNIGETRTNVADIDTTSIDNEFGDNMSITRHGGMMGSKHMMRGMDRENFEDEMAEVGNFDRKTNF